LKGERKMKNIIVTTLMLLMLLISTTPLILDIKPVEASVTGPSLIVDDTLNQIHAPRSAAAASAVTAKAVVTNLGVPSEENQDDSISGPAGLKAYYFDGSKGLLNPSDGNTWEMTVTNIDASLITGNKAFMFIVQDHGTGSGWESLIVQVHMNFYGAGGHLLQSFDNGWVLKSSHGFNPGDVPGKFDLRMLVQDLGPNYQVTPQFRLPSGVWQTFYDGSWTSANYELTKTRLAMQIDAGGGGTVAFDKPLAYSNGIWYADPNTTIQAAINAANSGQTIRAFNGVYHENLVVNKALTIKAASSPVIDGGAAGNCISVSANNVVISGFEIRNGYNGISGQTSGSTFSNNTMHDNLNIPGSAGVGILLWGDNDNNIITGNTIFDNDRQGIFIGYYDTTYISTGNIISYNTIYNNGLYRYANGPDASDYGIQLWTADNNVIEYNEIYGHDDWFPWGGTFDFAQGIYLCDSDSNLVTHNYLHGNNYGVGLWHPSRLVVTNTINYNNIAGNTGYGVCTFDSPPAVDARFNWWGDASGPTHPSNVGGLGDRISGNVDYSPWLGFVVGTSPMTWHVNPTGGSDAIQEAIDEASPGDTVIVHEGTYEEQLKINKDLTVQGLTGATVTAPNTRNRYTIPESTSTFDPIILAFGGTESSGAISGPETIEVVVDGFEVDGANKAAASPIRYVGILFRNVNQGTISNNYVHRMYDADGQGNGPETFDILTYGDSNVQVEYNEIRDFSRGGIGIQGDAGSLADPIAEVKSNVVVGNGMESGTGWWAENGIQVSYGAKANVTSNDVSDCQVNNPSWASTGILIHDAADGVEIRTNTVEDCDVGVAVSSPSYDVVEGNTITGCNWEGIRLGWPVNHCTVTNNTVTYCWAGIGVWDASENLIQQNVLENNEYGIYMDGDSDNNVITNNHILNNTADGIHAEPYGGNDPSGTQVHYNCIVGNGDYGIYKDGTETINATYNWWGDSTGPYHPTKNPSGLGNNVSDCVQFEPWLKAYFEYCRHNPIVNEPVTFDASLSTKPCNTRTITSYTWNFADSNTTEVTDPVIIHAFGTPGTYNVTLTLTYEDMSTATDWAIVYVAKEPYYKVIPEAVELGLRGKTFKVNVTINDLDASQEAVLYRFRLLYNSSLLQVMNVTEGPFLAQFNQTSTPPYTIFTSVDENSSTYGPSILITVYLQPNSTFGYPGPFPHGNGTIATIAFKAIYQEKGYDITRGGYFKPPLTCNLTLVETLMIDKTWSFSIPHHAENGNYTIMPNNVGDVNWDGKVRVDDVMLGANAFGSNEGDPRWNPDADVNGDKRIRVNDILIIARNFGWTTDC
jgi:parallel beta-helix repeat protein